MKKRTATGYIGTAAVLGLNLAACEKTPAAPVPERHELTGPSSAPTNSGADPKKRAGPDCQGEDRFTEACGYQSPTAYAVLDPEAIRNE